MNSHQTSTTQADPQLVDRAIEDAQCQIIRPIEDALLQAAAKQQEPIDDDTDPPIAA